MLQWPAPEVWQLFLSDSCQFRTAELPAHGNNGTPENWSAVDMQKYTSFFLISRQSYCGGFEICPETE